MSRPLFSIHPEQEPVTWLAGRAIYGAHLIAIVFVASMIATTIAMATRAHAPLDLAVFSSAEVLRGEIWRVFTYGLVNPPSIWFVIDMFMVVWFGRELEKFFGRRTFFTLYGGIYLITPLLFTALGFKWPLSLTGVPGALALFTAFATLLPNVALTFGILAKWAAAVLIGVYALIHLGSNNWPELLRLGATTGFAHLFVRHSQGALSLPSLSLPSRRVQDDADTPRPAARATKPVAPQKDPLMSEVDALLDRIAKSGIESLTPKERARLDAARETLLKRSKHG